MMVFALYVLLAFKGLGQPLQTAAMMTSVLVCGMCHMLRLELHCQQCAQNLRSLLYFQELITRLTPPVPCHLSDLLWLQCHLLCSWTSI